MLPDEVPEIIRVYSIRILEATGPTARHRGVLRRPGCSDTGGMRPVPGDPVSQWVDQVERQSIDGDELALILSVPGSTDREEVSLLYDLARGASRGCIVEVGSAKGRSTVALALGARRGSGAAVYAIEPHEQFRGVLGGVFTPRNRAIFLESLLRAGVAETVRLINVSSEVISPGWREPVALVFIDGDHRVDAVRRDFECWTTHVVEGGLVVFHDATDPSLGPAQVVDAVLGSGAYERVGLVSRATILRKVTPSRTGDGSVR